MQKSKILADQKPINFYFQLFGVFVRLLILFFFAWLIFYVVSDEVRKSFALSHINIAFFVFLGVTLIALLQTWYNSKIYIYYILYENGFIFLKWQEWNAFKEIRVPADSVKAVMKPSGVNSPYLEIKFVGEAREKKLNQTYYPGWNKNTMKEFIKALSEIKSELKETVD